MRLEIGLSASVLVSLTVRKFVFIKLLRTFQHNQSQTDRPHTLRQCEDKVLDLATSQGMVQIKLLSRRRSVRYLGVY